MSNIPGQNRPKGKRPGRRKNEKARHGIGDDTLFQITDYDASGSDSAKSLHRAKSYGDDKQVVERGSSKHINQSRTRRNSGSGEKDDRSEAVKRWPLDENDRAVSNSANKRSGSGYGRVADGGDTPGFARENGKRDAESRNRLTTDKRYQSTQEKSKHNSHSKRRKKSGARAGPSDEERLARSLRAPVQRAPDSAYTPKSSQNRTQQNNNQQNNRKSHNGKSHRRNQNSGKSRELYAALDLGTNNCRLLIALPQERGRFRVIDGYSRIVRLGEGLDKSGRLSEAAMGRCLEALRICADKLISHDIKRYRLIATEACRQAENGAEFLNNVKLKTGMELEIIDRQTEAYLAAEGCGTLMDKKADAAVLFDIGGGSSELVLINKRIKRKRIADQIVSWTSVPIGVVTLAERYTGSAVTPQIFEDMITEVKQHLDQFEGRDELAKLWNNGRVHLLGTSGTVTTLAGVHLNLPRYERRLVDGLWLKSSDIDVVIQQLLEMDDRQRAANPCVGNDRADLVMAGCAILEAIRRTWPSERLRVADRGLREGILTQLMERDAAWITPKAGRWQKKRTNKKRSNSKAKGFK